VTFGIDRCTSGAFDFGLGAIHNGNDRFCFLSWIFLVSSNNDVRTRSN